jgi:phage shock protein A
MGEENIDEIKKALHEIGNKIAIVSGYSELLLHTEMSEDAKEKVKKMNKACFDIIVCLKKLRIKNV